MPLNWPIEALKAQAIAARSYTLSMMNERQKMLFHVESSILDQVFSHVSQSLDNDALIQKAKTAVIETENKILRGPKNKVIKAFYHSDCGGRTVSSKSVWGMGELVGGAIDASCPANPKSNWTLNIAQLTLSQKVAKFFKMDSLKNIVELITKKTKDQDRISDLAIRFEDGSEKAISATDFRGLIGSTELRSTKFELTKKADHFQFIGKGFGHGVGLCQWGTRALAQKGWAYTQILAHYYPESRVETRLSR
jgi:stage II sporulation protein D